MKILLSILTCITAILLYQQQDLITSKLTNFMASTTNSTNATSAPKDSNNRTSFPGLPAVPPSDPSLNKPANMSVPRTIRQAFHAISQSEGAGARVRRSIGTPKLRNFSPFLMLDHFAIPPGAGFPDHPHRGQARDTSFPNQTHRLFANQKLFL